MMKHPMPAFLAKKKRDPKSAAPAKNTKGRSVTKAKTKEQVDKEQDRGGDRVPSHPVPNKADAALSMLSKPRNQRNRGY